jgi:Mg2+-importing ATPase
VSITESLFIDVFVSGEEILNKLYNGGLAMTRLITKIEKRNKLNEILRRNEVLTRMNFAAAAETEDLFKKLATGPDGVYEAFVVDYRDEYGNNNFTLSKKVILLKRLAKAFNNPFTSILFVLAVLSAFSEIIFAKPGDAYPMAVIIISVMTLISGILRFIQETRSGHTAENFLKLIKTTANVRRQETGNKEIPISEVVVGDIVHLSAGDMIPADMRIIKAKDLFVSQSALTGESAAVEKIPDANQKVHYRLTDTPNLVFMGSRVISGSATGVVVAVGDYTVFSEMANNKNPVRTGFENEVNSLSFMRWRWSLYQNCFR